MKFLFTVSRLITRLNAT